MELPLNFTALLEEATNIEGARSIPLSVGVFIDDTAPTELIAHVRSRFATESPSVRVEMTYLSSSRLLLDPQADIAVIVAGLADEVGLYADRIRRAGIPVMVVTTLPKLVGEIAEANGLPIPEGDILSPIDVLHPYDMSLDALERHARANALKRRGLADEQDAQPKPAEPLAFDERAKAVVDERMGCWIIDTCDDRRLAFALAFPFVRIPLCKDSIAMTAAQNAGVGFIAFIPGADLPIMTLNQAKMVLEIAAAHGQELSKERVKELACVIAGGFACRGVARQLVAVVPGLGWTVKAIVGYTGTVAMGVAALEYFNGGGDIVGLASMLEGVRKNVTSALSTANGMVSCARRNGPLETAQAAGQVLAPAVASKASNVAGLVTDRALPAVLAAGSAALDAMRGR